MTPSEFCMWLNGFFELAGADVTNLSVEQLSLIKKRLAGVMMAADPGTYVVQPASPAQEPDITYPDPSMMYKPGQTYR